MSKENTQNQSKFRFVIGEEYVERILERTFEARFTDEQWDELYDRLCRPVYDAVYDTVSEMLDYDEMIESNRDAGKIKPYFVVKYKNPDANVPEWKEQRQCFKSEADAKAYIDYNHEGVIGEEWKIEKRD